MFSYCDLIALIEQKPAMYLGKPHLSLLRAFLDGWGSALHQAGLQPTDGEVIDDFQAWIEKKYRSNTTHGWHQIILYYSEDERTALTDFFRLFTEWRAQPHKPKN